MIATTLSPRETTVLRLIAWGHTNKEIAKHLGISVKTIEAHRYNGFRKLNLTGRSGLVRYAVGAGWLTIDAAPAPLSAERNAAPQTTSQSGAS